MKTSQLSVTSGSLWSVIAHFDHQKKNYYTIKISSVTRFYKPGLKYDTAKNQLHCESAKEYSWPWNHSVGQNKHKIHFVAFSDLNYISEHYHERLKYTCSKVAHNSDLRDIVVFTIFLLFLCMWKTIFLSKLKSCWPEIIFICLHRAFSDWTWRQYIIYHSMCDQRQRSW